MAGAAAGLLAAGDAFRAAGGRAPRRAPRRMALVGLADDRYGLPIAPRLVVQAAAALAIAPVTGGFPRLPLPAPLDVALGALRRSRWPRSGSWRW